MSDRRALVGTVLMVALSILVTFASYQVGHQIWKHNNGKVVCELTGDEKPKCWTHYPTGR